jgi:hypothetical protein
VRASQLGNGNYLAAADADQTFSVAKAAQTISFTNPGPRTFGDAPFALVATGGASGNAVTFAIITGPASVSGNTLTITGAGSVTVRASQLGNGNYFAATDVDQIFSVAKAAQTISFTNPGGKTFGDVPFTLVASGGGSGNVVTFALVSGPASVSGNTLTITGAGDVTVRASQLGNGNYFAAADVDATFTVAKAGQTITFAPLGGKTFGDAPFTVSATGGASGQPVTFTASGPASVSGNLVTLTGAGDVTITAHQAGNANYTAAADVPQTFTVAKAAQTISFTNPGTRTFGDVPFGLVATGGGSGNAVTFSIVSGPASVSGSTLTITGAGDVTVRASQLGNANYFAATDVDRTFTVAKAAQTISFTNPGPRTFGDAPFGLVASGGGSGNTVTFAIVSGPATVSGSTLTITGAGSVTVRASQLGNANYAAAADADQTFSVAKAAQTISFTNPGAHTVGDPPFALVASGGGSGNAVTFSIVSGPATVSGSTLTVTGAGSVTVRASQLGNANYFAATDVDRTFNVAKAAQTISFTNPGARTFGDAPFGLVATGGGSGNAVTFAIVSGPATVSGSVLTITGAGDVTVRASQLGNADYFAATDVDTTFTVATAGQIITFASLGGKTFGDAPFTVSATGGPSGQPVTFTASGPASVSGSTVTLTGAGDVTITAHQAGPGNYAAASDVPRTFTVAKAAQTISFTLAASAQLTDTVPLSATGGGSGNAVSFSVFSGPGSITGNSLTFSGGGNVVVRASQAGNADYLAAVEVDRTITVTLPPAGTLAFATATPSVRPVDGQGMANRVSVQITRTDGSYGAVTVPVTQSQPVTVPSGFAKYVYGTDYEFVNGTSAGTTVSFADGQTGAAVEVQLKTPAVTKKGQFKLTLGTPTGGAGLGSATVATVTVRERDTTKPVITVTAPLGQTVTANFDVTGKVTENDALASFIVRLNGVAQTPLTSDPLSGFVAGSPRDFRAQSVAPENGSNTLEIEAIDASGNKTTVTRILSYTNVRTNLVGTYTGLLVPAVTPNVDNVGRVTITVMATGSFTGRALVSGVGVNFSGLLQNSGAAAFGRTRAAAVALIDRTDAPLYLGVLALKVDATDGLTGTLSTLTTGGTVLANFAGKAGVAEPAPASAVGIFNVAFPSKVQSPALDVSTYPQGDGFARLRVSNTGTAVISGRLADGSICLASSKVRIDGTVPFFVPLYRRLGALSADLLLSPAANSDLSASPPLWLRPAMARAQYYPQGWPTGVRLDAIGTRYASPASFNFGQGDANPTAGNARLVFTHGLLSSDVNKFVSVNPGVNPGAIGAGVVTLIPAVNPGYKFSFNYVKKVGLTGVFTGSFLHTDGTTTAYVGVLLNKGTTRGGYGYFLSTPTAERYVGAAESGRVFLGPAGP